MLISDIATIVQNSIGDRGGILARTDLVIHWVNEAILDIYRQTELGREAPATFSLAADANSFDPKTVLSKEILRVHYMHNGTFEMEETSLDQLLDIFGPEYFTSSGAPRYFYRTFVSGHTVLGFVPKADIAYTISYSFSFTPAKFTAASNNTDTALPSSYDNDVIRFCIMRAHELEKDFRASEKAQEHYDKNMYARADESHQLDDGYSRISADELDYL